MKKLIMAVAVVCAAVAVQAGQVKWSTMTALYTAGETDVAASGKTLQLVMVAAGTSFDSVWSTVKDGTFVSSATATTDSAGKITANTYTVPEGTYDLYTVCVDGDQFFISAATANKTVATVGSLTYGASLKAASNTGVIFDVASGVQGAGWYSSVPEPTSGLLLLLGMAGLALRRRRA